jgi:hypothetical protein
VKKTVLGGIALTAVAVLASPGYAFASDTTGTATLTGGSLSLVAPATVGFSATLTGQDQTAQADQAIDVLDNTGSGAGWNVTLTSTTFTDGTHSLANDSVSDVSSSGACDTSVSCVLADNVVGQGAVAIPAGVSAPTAVKIMNASTDKGMGGQTWTHHMALALPANVHAGIYTSTWTYSLVSAP